MLTRPNGSQGSSRFNRSDDTVLGYAGSALQQTTDSLDRPELGGGIAGLAAIVALEIVLPAKLPFSKLVVQAIPAFVAGQYVSTMIKKREVGQVKPEFTNYEFANTSYAKYSYKTITGLKPNSMQRPDCKTEGGGIPPGRNLGPDTCQFRSNGLPNMRINLPGNFAVSITQKETTKNQPSSKTSKAFASISTSWSSLDWVYYLIILEKVEVSHLSDPDPNQTQDVIKEPNLWYSDFTAGLDDSYSSMQEDVPLGCGIDESESSFDSSVVEIVLWSGAILIGGKMIGQFILWVGKTKKDN